MQLFKYKYNKQSWVYIYDLSAHRIMNLFVEHT